MNLLIDPLLLSFLCFGIAAVTGLKRYGAMSFFGGAGFLLLAVQIFIWFLAVVKYIWNAI